MRLITSTAFTSAIPFVDERFKAAAIYCSDGHYFEQIEDFLHHGLHFPHYDCVAIPGGCACLAHQTAAMRERFALSRQLQFLMSAHRLTRVVLIAHQNCGFYRQNLDPA